MFFVLDPGVKESRTLPPVSFTAGGGAAPDTFSAPQFLLTP
jgi:hypothetical protein